MPSLNENPATDSEHRADAERIAHQRALADNARRITDPLLRAEVQALATDVTTSAEFVRFVDSSPQAWRGLQRTVTTYLGLTDQQRAMLVVQFQQQTAAIQAELDRPASPPAPSRRIEPREADESWETRQSWLE